MYPQVHVDTALCCQYIQAAIYGTRYSPAKADYLLFGRPLHHRKSVFGAIFTKSGKQFFSETIETGSIILGVFG